MVSQNTLGATMKILTVCVLLLAFLVGCTTMDTALSRRGVLEETKSKMDGQRIVTMSPVLSKSGPTDIQAEFGLYWDDAKGENALLLVEIGGAHNFDPEKPFEMKVDGKLFKLHPARSRDYGDIAHNKSSKNYVVHKSQIPKIANGKEAFYRIWLLKNRFSDGEVSYQYQDYQSFVPHSFRRFYAQVWK